MTNKNLDYINDYIDERINKLNQERWGNNNLRNIGAYREQQIIGAVEELEFIKRRLRYLDVEVK